MSSRPDRAGRHASTVSPRSATVPEAVAELTTVSSTEAVVHDGLTVRVSSGLTPDTSYEIDGFSFRTLPDRGELLTTFAAVNDVHFGEIECGVVSGSNVGPTFRTEPGDDPYPEVMNRAAVAEIAAIDPAAVMVKGDLTSNGTAEEYEAFLAAYRPVFGDRLHHVRGNHESYNHAPFAVVPTQEVVLPGARLAMIDTSLEGLASGGVSRDQLAWLDALASESDRPVLVFGHHHVWDPASVERPPSYFGIRPDDSEALVEVVARRRSILGYFAGHTHRNRVRRFAATGDLPWVEVACVKDYPGGWAEYRVHEDGIQQIFHRIGAEEALVWTEKTRHMYEGLYAPYAFGTLADRCFEILPRG